MRRVAKRPLRKRAKKMLPASEQRFQLVARATNDAVWDWDLVTDEVWWNEHVTTLFGYPMADVRSDISWWYEHLHPEDERRVVSALHSTINEQGHSWSDEYRFLRQDGSYAYVLDRGYVMHDRRGKPVRMIGAMVDVTKARLAEKALRESQQRLQAILDHSPAVIFLKDINGRYLLCNPPYERFRGLSRDQIIGKTDRELFAPVQAAKFRGNDLEVLEAGEPMQFEETILYPEGARTSIVSKFPLRDADGQIYAIGGIVTDITDRKRAEDDLRKQKEILQKIFESVPAMINFIDAQGRLQLVNPAWERTLGWTLEEIHKENLNIFAETYPDPEDCRKVLNFLAEPNGGWTDFRPRVRDGRLIDTAWAIVHLSDGTSIGIGQDITERKRAEEELRRSREQLRALAGYLESVREEERGRVARELHDEIGQALTGIKFSLENHIREQNRYSSAGLAQALAVTNELIGKVRDLSLELRPAMLDDLGLLAALRWHFERYTNQVKVEVDFAHTGIEGRRFDPEIETAAYRIVQEALTNVARYAGIGRVEVNLRADDSTLSIEVKDRGRGFDVEHLLAGASGGLSGMRERAVLLRGQLKIEAAPGAGTLLCAELPLRRKESAAAGSRVRRALV